MLEKLGKSDILISQGGYVNVREKRYRYNKVNNERGNKPCFKRA